MIINSGKFYSNNKNNKISDNYWKIVVLAK